MRTLRVALAQINTTVGALTDNANKMIDLILSDKKNNPSNYALLIMSEGAEWEGYTTREYGEPDAFGHRKKFSVAEDFSDQIKARSKQETVVSDLTYDLRSGAPDFLDSMIATTFGAMAYDSLKQGKHGLMAAISDGKYAMMPIPDPKLGPRKVDIASMYNVDRYRPNYANHEGVNVFLTTR